MREMIEIYEDFFKTLGQETRLEMIMLLAEGKEIPQSKIWNDFFLAQPSIQHHLRAMLRTGIISGRKSKPLTAASQGKFAFYKLNLSFIEDTFKDFCDLIRNQARGGKSVIG